MNMKKKLFVCMIIYAFLIIFLSGCIDNNLDIEYKTIQETKERFVVKLVKNDEFSERTLSEVKKQIMIGCLGEEVEVEVECVEELPKERTGKKRAVVSKVY